MRRKIKNRNQVQPDRVYNSVKVAKFINYIMLGGQKEVASRVLYESFEIIKEKTKNPNPLEVFENALKNAGPVTEVRSRRVGGANYQVPREVRPERRLTLAMRWMLEEARRQTGRPMAQRLSQEIMSAANNEGGAVKKKENTHKMAEANKAFAHFSW